MVVSTIWADDASAATNDSSNMHDYHSSTLRSMTRNSFHMNEGGYNNRSIHTRQIAKSGYNVRVTEKTPSPHSLLEPNKNDRPKPSRSSSAPTIKRHNREQSLTGNGIANSIRDLRTDRSPKPALASKNSSAEKLNVGLHRALSPPNMEALYRRSIQHTDSTNRDSIRTANVSLSRRTSTNTARMPENDHECQRSLVAHPSSWQHSTSKSPKRGTKMATSSPVRVRVDRLPSSKFTKSEAASKASAELLMLSSNLPKDSVPGQNEIQRNDGHPLKPSTQHRKKSNHQAFQTSLHHQSDHQCRQGHNGNLSSITLRLPDESTNEVPLVRKCSQRPQRSQSSPKLLTIEVLAKTTNELQCPPRFSGDSKNSSPSRTHLHSSSCPNTPSINAAACPTCSRQVPDRFDCCQVLEPTHNNKVESEARNTSGRFIVSDHSDEQLTEIIPKVVFINHCPDHSDNEKVRHLITKLDLSPINSRRRQSFGKNSTHRGTLGTHSNHDFPNSNIHPFKSRDVCSNLHYQRRRSMGQVTQRFDDLVSSHLHSSSKVSESVASELTFDSSFVSRRKSFGPVARHGDELSRWIRAPRRRSLGPPSIITASRRSPTPV